MEIQLCLPTGCLPACQGVSSGVTPEMETQPGRKDAAPAKLLRLTGQGHLQECRVAHVGPRGCRGCTACPEQRVMTGSWMPGKRAQVRTSTAVLLCPALTVLAPRKHGGTAACCPQPACYHSAARTGGPSPSSPYEFAPGRSVGAASAWLLPLLMVCGIPAVRP